MVKRPDVVLRGYESPMVVLAQAPRQPELEEALFEIGELLVGEVELENLVKLERMRRSREP